MNLIFQEILAASLALTIAAYGSAIALTHKPNANPDRTQVIESLLNTGNLGSAAITGLLTLNLLKLGARKRD